MKFGNLLDRLPTLLTGYGQIDNDLSFTAICPSSTGPTETGGGKGRPTKCTQDRGAYRDYLTEGDEPISRSDRGDVAA